MGSDLVERAAPPSEIFVCIKNGAISVGNGTEMSTDRDDVAGHAHEDEETVRYVLPTANPERADVATLERVRAAVSAAWVEADNERIDAQVESGVGGDGISLRERTASGVLYGVGRALKLVDAMLTEARARPAAPLDADCAVCAALDADTMAHVLSQIAEATGNVTSGHTWEETLAVIGSLWREKEERENEPAASGEVAALLASADRYASGQPLTVARHMVERLAAALRATQARLAEVEAERDALRANTVEAVDVLATATRYDGDRGAHALVVVAQKAVAKLQKAEADLAREREAHEAELSGARQALEAAGCAAYESDARCTEIPDGERIRRLAAERDAARAEVERLKAEADRLRAAAEPVRWDDVEGLCKVAWYATEVMASWDWLSEREREERRTEMRAVLSALARSLLTDGAVDVAHSVAWHADYRITTRQVRTVIEKALEHAGLHVAAEPVADESDADVMLAAVREKMAPEHVAEFDAARAAAAADAERTRSVLMGALDKAKRLRVDPAKAATLPRASIGLPAPAAELVVEAAISRADVSERRAARMEAVKSQHERPDTTWHSFDEYVAGVKGKPVAEGRACPWEERRDNIGAAIRMVHKANEPHSSAVHAVTIALEQLAIAVDEIRRLGGGGR